MTHPNWGVSSKAIKIQDLGQWETGDITSAPSSEDSADDEEREEVQEEVWAEAEGLEGCASADRWAFLSQIRYY